jgi:hypothetical protein
LIPALCWGSIAKPRFGFPLLLPPLPFARPGFSPLCPRLIIPSPSARKNPLSPQRHHPIPLRHLPRHRFRGFVAHTARCSWARICQGGPSSISAPRPNFILLALTHCQGVPLLTRFGPPHTHTHSQGDWERLRWDWCTEPGGGSLMKSTVLRYGAGGVCGAP